MSADDMSMQASMNYSDVISAFDAMIAKQQQFQSSLGGFSPGIGNTIEKDLAKAEGAISNTTKGLAQDFKMSGSQAMQGLFGEMDKAEAMITTKGSRLSSLFGGGFLGGMSDTGGKMANKVTADMEQAFGKMQKSYVAQSGYMGSLASIAGPYGIAAAAILGFGVAAEQAAEKHAKLMKGLADATGLKQSSEEMSKLSGQIQAARVKTGLSDEMLTTAAKVAAPTTALPDLAATATSASIWASKWKADVASVTQEMTNLGSKMKGPQESMSQFSDKTGSAIDAVAKKMAAVGGENILRGFSALAPTLAKLKPPEDTIPAWIALEATFQSFGKSPEIAARSVNTLITALSSSKAQVDMAKLIGIDTKTFAAEFEKDTVGTIQKIAEKIGSLPLAEKTKALKELGPAGKDLMAQLSDTSGLDRFKSALQDSTSGFTSGKTAVDQWGKGLQASEVGLSRIKEGLTTMLEKLGGPFISGFGGAANAVADFIEQVTPDLERFADLIGDLTGGVVDFGQEVASGLGSALGMNFNVDKDYVKQRNDIISKYGLTAQEFGAMEESGMTMAQIQHEAYIKKLQADTSEVDPNVKTNMQNMGTDLGETAGEATAKGFEEELEGQASRFEAGMTYVMKDVYNKKGQLMAAAGWTSGYESPTGRALAHEVSSLDIGSFKFVWDDQNYLRLPDGTEKFFKTLPDVIPYIEDYIGRDLSNWEKSKMLGEVQNQIRIEAKVDMKAVDYELFSNTETKMKSKWQELGTKWGEAMADGTLTAMEVKGMLPLVTELARMREEQPELWAKVGGPSGDAFLNSMLALDWKGAFEAKGTEAGQSFTSALLGTVYNMTDTKLSDLLADPVKLAKNVTSYTNFYSSQVKPALESDFKGINDIYLKGTRETDAIAKNWLLGMADLAEREPNFFSYEEQQILRWYKVSQDAFTSSNELIRGHRLTLDEAMTGLGRAIDWNNKEVKSATVGYNNLAKALEGCDECAMSLFGTWQETNAGDLFEGGYLGPGGQRYLDWKLNYLQRQADTAAAMSLIGGYTAGRYEISTSINRTEFDAMVAEINKGMSMHVRVSIEANALEIRSMVESAIYEALQYVS